MGGPPSRLGPPASLRATTMITGTSASTSSRAWILRRRNRWCSSASNIEALPGERYEQVLERGPFDREPEHPDAAAHERRADLFRSRVGGLLGGDRSGGKAGHEAGVPQNGGGQVDVFGLHSQPGRRRSPERSKRVLDQQPTEAHHADVGAGLLDLG